MDARSKHTALQVRPGEYNNEALEAMDQIMDTARQLGLKVLLSFADNWKFHGMLRSLCLWFPTRPAERALPLSTAHCRWNRRDAGMEQDGAQAHSEAPG